MWLHAYSKVFGVTMIDSCTYDLPIDLASDQNHSWMWLHVWELICTVRKLLMCFMARLFVVLLQSSSKNWNVSLWLCSLKHRWEDLCKFRFFPYRKQYSFQLYELDDDYIQQEIQKPPKLTSCTVSFSCLAVLISILIFFVCVLIWALNIWQWQWPQCTYLLWNYATLVWASFFRKGLLFLL